MMSNNQSGDLKTITMCENIVKSKLKIRISLKKVETESMIESSEFRRQLPHNCDDSKPRPADTFKVKLPVRPSNKRGPPGMVDGHKEKRLKMDRSVKQQCSSILKTLMSHPAGWVFNRPVDPVALNIPDYFSIITKPMDLGTIKTKLEDYMYFTVEEFAADVRLTFSNAMIYNPPSNNVHLMAKELDNVFTSRWKSLQRRVSCESRNFELGFTIKGRIKNSQETEGLSHLKDSLSAREVKADKVKMAENGRHRFASKNAHKVNNKSAGGFADTKPLLSSVDHAYTSHSTDLSSERSVRRDHNTSKKDCEEKNMLASCVSKLDEDSHSSLNEESMCSTPPHSGASPVIDIQLSPKKALRAAMLKSRFAETIFKAKQRTLLDNVTKADLVTIQQEKERLERQQQKDKAKIDAEIRAAEAASRLKVQEEVKKKREREREAARIALQKMEKTAEIYNNIEILKDLEMLRVSVFDTMEGGGRVRNPLERLGLFMKDEFLGDETDDDETPTLKGGDSEEGEIL